MENALFNLFHSWANVSAGGDWLVIVAAKYLPWGLVIGALFLIFRGSSRLPAGKASVKRLENLIFVALALLVSRGLLTELIRYFVERERPFVTLDFVPLIEQSATYALPSGHAAIFFALAVSVWFIDRKWGYWFGAFALFNGIARVVAGVHWPADILAGAVVGILSALLVRLLLNKISKRA